MIKTKDNNWVRTLAYCKDLEFNDLDSKQHKQLFDNFDQNLTGNFIYNNKINRAFRNQYFTLKKSL